MNTEIENRLKDIKIEELIWIIYLGIIFLSFYSNNLEKDYFVNNNEEAKEKYRKIMILIFSILVIVYLFFFKDSYDDIKKINNCDEDKRKKVIISFIASTLILISGILFLYLSINDENLDVELAFN